MLTDTTQPLAPAAFPGTPTLDDLRTLSNRARRAASGGEAPEVVSVLLLDVYEAVVARGTALDSTTASIYSSYCAVRMMHGMRDARRSWWDRWRHGRHTDFSPVIAAYRADER